MDVAADVSKQRPHCSFRSGGGPCPDTFIDSCFTHLSQRQATFLFRVSCFAIDWFGHHFIRKLAKCYLDKCIQFACKLPFVWPTNTSSVHGLNTACMAPKVSKGLFLWIPCWDLNKTVQSWCNTCSFTSVTAFMALQECALTLAWKWRILSHRNYLSGIYMLSKLMRFVCCASRPHLFYKCSSSSLAIGWWYHFT